MLLWLSVHIIVWNANRLALGQMNEETCPLVTDEPIEFEKKNWLKFKISRELPVIQEESIKCTSIT